MVRTLADVEVRIFMSALLTMSAMICVQRLVWGQGLIAFLTLSISKRNWGCIF